MSAQWEVEHWYISDILTGYRVIRREGQNMEIAQGFTADRYFPETFDAALLCAQRLRDRLNNALLRGWDAERRLTQAR